VIYVGIAMPSPSELLRDINAGVFKPAYYFYGPEDYRIIEATKYLARQFLPDRQLQTNYRKLSGRKNPAREVMAELANLPMLGERQVFSISDFQSYQPADVERILGMLRPPDSTRVVVFSSPSPRTPKKTSKFFKAVQAAGIVMVEFPRLTAKEVRAQIQTRLQKAGLQIEPEALRVLVDLVAGNLGAVAAETDKLANYRGKGGTVTVDDVTAVAAGYETINIFTLADQIVTEQPHRVLRSLEQLIAEGNSPVTICTLLSTHFLRLYLVRHRKPVPGNMAWLESRLRPQANRFDSARLEQILIDLAEAEAQLRGGGLPPRLALEILVVGLMPGRDALYG